MKAKTRQIASGRMISAEKYFSLAFLAGALIPLYLAVITLKFIGFSAIFWVLAAMFLAPAYGLYRKRKWAKKAGFIISVLLIVIFALFFMNFYSIYSWLVLFYVVLFFLALPLSFIIYLLIKSRGVISAVSR